MNDQEQRIAIAEACGWQMALSPDYLGLHRPVGKPRPQGLWQTIPNYLNDLNAMHEAEKVLTHEQQDRMARWVGRHDT